MFGSGVGLGGSGGATLGFEVELGGSAGGIGVGVGQLRVPAGNLVHRDPSQPQPLAEMHEEQLEKAQEHSLVCEYHAPELL